MTGITHILTIVTQSMYRKDTSSDKKIEVIRDVSDRRDKDKFTNGLQHVFLSDKDTLTKRKKRLCLSSLPS